MFTDSFCKFYISKANCKLKAEYKNTNLSSFDDLSNQTKDWPQDGKTCAILI